VISAKTGHVFANEAGAIESTGHKVIAVDSADGKLTPDDIKQVINAHKMRPHVVKPAMVYISNATETGTIYNKAELQTLSELCRRENLLLFLDGARLGYALTAPGNDLGLGDIAALTDAFYIGGTKNGALLGEAIVLPAPASDYALDYIIKQKGALMAKSRILGIQFYELFKDDLYFRLASRGNAAAKRISAAMRECGFDFLTEPCANQLFPILPHAFIEALGKTYLFYIWKNIDPEHSAIRMITSWATSEEKVNRFITDLKAICEKNQYLNGEVKLQ
jgi:threonine aldolase